MIGTTDFTGKWEVATNKFSNLLAYIHRYEDAYIYELFGKELGDEFLSDPNATKWDDLKLIGFGLESLLVGFVWCEYVRDLPFRVVNKGVVYQDSDNSGQVIPDLVIRQRYNECVTDFNKMVDYLRENFDDYSQKRLKYMID